MKVSHVIAGLAVHNGGPSYSVPRLCTSLTLNGCHTELLSVQEHGSPILDQATFFRQDAPSLPVFSTLRLSGALRQALEKRAAEANIVHNHGLWLMPNVYAGHAARNAGTPLVVSPRGMLAKAALRYSPLKKKIFWATLQRRAFDGAALWHATSAEEAENIRTFGIRAPIAIIPNGIDIPEYTATHSDLASRRTLVFMSRLHPKKGLEGLIEAWSRLEQERPDWDLVIAGPDEGGYEVRLKAQAAQAGCRRISFTGPVYGSGKADLLKRSDLFVLPTQNENFGLVVGEALAAGIPSIVTKGAPWSGLESEACGWWIDHGLQPLLGALRSATAASASVRREMGLHGRAWMARDYGWDAIAEEMICVYRWITEDGERPRCMADV
jgi:glycosyltransferase involved in cell wall biosynthesis